MRKNRLRRQAAQQAREAQAPAEGTDNPTRLPETFNDAEVFSEEEREFLLATLDEYEGEYGAFASEKELSKSVRAKLGEEVGTDGDD